MVRKYLVRIFILSLLLTNIGLFLIYDATVSRLISQELSPFLFVNRQLVAFLFGIIFFFFFISIPFRVWERAWFLVYLLNVILLILVFFFGRRSLGAQRWFSIFGFSFQPSELSKLFIIISISGFLIGLSKHRKSFSFKDYALIIFLILIPTMLVVIQPDLGTAIVIFASGIFVLYLFGIPTKYIVRTFFLILTILPFLWLFLKPYQQERILTFFDPMRDPLGSGYQVIQSMIAIGSGRIFGKGWLQGPQTHLNLIPEQHTDFIFSALAEEFGFVGSVLLVFLYYLLFRNIWEVWRRLKDDFGRLVVGGIFFTLLFQTFINLSMVMGMAPVVGIPLPFISFARTSLIVSYSMLGLMFNIALRSEIDIL